MIPRSSSSRSSRTAKTKRNNSGRSVGKQHFINSKTSSGSALRVRVADDMTRPALTPDLARVTMPKSIQTQIHWFTCDFANSASLSTTTVTEMNQPFALNSLPSGFANAIAALFDQYAIYAVYARVLVNATVNVAANPRFFTALDYDNTTNLGSVTAIQQYGTVAESSLTEVQERYLEPCNAPALWTGSVFTGFGQSRMWCDSASQSIFHYGLRILVDSIGSGGTGTVNAEYSLVICGRQTI